MFHGYRKQSRVGKSGILEDADWDLAVVQVPEALHEEAPLQTEGSQEQVDAHAAESVSLQEGHKEAEADEDHNVDILKHCRNERRGQLCCWIDCGCSQGSHIEISLHDGDV